MKTIRDSLLSSLVFPSVDLLHDFWTISQIKFRLFGAIIYSAPISLGDPTIFIDVIQPFTSSETWSEAVT